MATTTPFCRLGESGLFGLLCVGGGDVMVFMRVARPDGNCLWSWLGWAYLDM